MWLVLMACYSESKLDTSIYIGDDRFCDDPAEALDEVIIEDSVSGSNGRLEGQLIAPDAPNPTDSTVIGGTTYILDNLGSGGGEHLEYAGPLGDIRITLGGGSWELQLEGPTGCRNQMEIEIEAGSIHQLCIPIYCEE
jgi:hypothetical protein